MAPWNVTEDGVSLTIPFTMADLTITFQAFLLRQERTGIHARAFIRNGSVNVWDNFNLEKSDERIRLVNSFYKRADARTRAAYEPEQCKQDFDTFCEEAWSRWIGQAAPTLLEGAEPAAVDFVLEPYIVEHGGTLAFAPPKALKSHLVLLMAVSVDAGVSRFWPVTQCPVLVVNLERAAKRYTQRLGAINTVLGLPRNRPLHTLNGRGRSLADVAPQVRAYVRQHGIKVVVWDSLSRAGMGKLVADEVGNAIMDMATAICPTWLMVAHTPRADKTHTLGTQMFDAAADVLVQVQAERPTKPEKPAGVCLQLTGENDIGYRPPQVLAFEFNRLGLTNVRLARPFEFPDLLKGVKQNTTEEVVDYLHENRKGFTDEMAEALGVSRVRVTQILRDSERFVRLPKEGRKQPYGLRSEEEVPI